MIPLIKFKKLNTNAIVPKYASEKATGADLYATEKYSIGPGESTLIKTGLAVELPEGYELQIRPRSGLALKQQITVLNTPGSIDNDYRGEIGVILINHSKGWKHVERGDRVAQAVLAPYVQGQYVEVEELDVTERGSGGFGSTGTATVVADDDGLKADVGMKAPYFPIRAGNDLLVDKVDPEVDARSSALQHLASDADVLALVELSNFSTEAAVDLAVDMLKQADMDVTSESLIEMVSTSVKQALDAETPEEADVTPEEISAPADEPASVHARGESEHNIILDECPYQDPDTLVVEDAAPKQGEVEVEDVVIEQDKVVPEATAMYGDLVKQAIDQVTSTEEQFDKYVQLTSDDDKAELAIIDEICALLVELEKESEETVLVVNVVNDYLNEKTASV